MSTVYQNEVDRLNAVKNRIRTNLVSQGVIVPADAVLDEMATLILSVAGEDGQRGTGILSTTTGISSYTTAVGGVTPAYRILLSTLKTQAKVDDVLVGDTVRYSYYLYPVIYVDADYAYMGTRVNIRGSAGAALTVKSVSESTEAGGSNVVTFSDNTTLTVKNGNEGPPGPKPVMGTDYWTPADQESVVQQVIIALGKPVIGEVDANKNITLTGELPSGTYSIKYETADGELIEVGQIEIGGVAYTNQLPISTDASGAIYNGKGWKEDTRLNTDGTDKTGATGFVATGFIPCGNDAVIRVKSNVAVTNSESSQAICIFDTSKTHIKRLNWSALTTGSNALTVNSDGSIEYHFKASNWTECSGKTVGFIRLAFPGINDSTIITVNEEIV